VFAPDERLVRHIMQAVNTRESTGQQMVIMHPDEVARLENGCEARCEVFIRSSVNCSAFVRKFNIGFVK
jgi:hypothetical protein